MCYSAILFGFAFAITLDQTLARNFLRQSFNSIAAVLRDGLFDTVPLGALIARLFGQRIDLNRKTLKLTA